MNNKGRRKRERKRRRRLQCYYDFVVWLARNTPWRKSEEIIKAWSNVRKKAKRDLSQNKLYGYIDDEVMKLEGDIDDIGIDKCIGVMKHWCGKYYYLKLI